MTRGSDGSEDVHAGLLGCSSGCSLVRGFKRFGEWQILCDGLSPIQEDLSKV
jgi:hypothetical protein